jgi:dTDP-glucose 4,6-dehydratase
MRTYNFPAIIVRPCNNYGPWQYPEKLIPLAILKIIKKQKVPVYADGKNVREWLYVEDCAEGIMQISKKGKTGETYNLGSSEERQNIEVVNTILDLMQAPHVSIKFVKDRPGHDIRYRLNSGKVFNALGWQPKINLNAGLKATVEWYLAHRQWLLSKWRSIAAIYNYTG